MGANPRIQQLASRFKENAIDAYLVTNSVNITYLTGFSSTGAWLLILPKKAFYITDFIYALEANRSLRGVKVERYSRSFEETLFQLVKASRVKRLGFDTRHVSLALYKKIKKTCPQGVALVERNFAVEQLREIKSPDEIDLIRKAVKLNLAAYRYLGNILKPGMTEKDILTRLEHYVKARGASFSFDPIIASGPNACFPHAKVTDRKFKRNEPLLVDLGIDISGYKSDLTRMFFLGKIPPHVWKVHELVRFAQRQAIQKIRPGIISREIDQQARNFLQKKGLARFFGHSLGHGIGLEVHEGPKISAKSSTVLQKGMVFTVEPGVYIPNKFGVRIEDMVLVTENGCEVLSN